MPSLRSDIIFFKDPFFHAVITDWNNLDANIRKHSPTNVFKKEPLKFIKPEPNSTNNIHDTKQLKLFTRLQSVIYVITNSNTTLKNVYPQYVREVGILKKQFEILFHYPSHYCVRKIFFYKINQTSGNVSVQSDSTTTKILLIR